MLTEVTIDFYGDPLTINIPLTYEQVTEGLVEEDDYAISLPNETWVNIKHDYSELAVQTGVGAEIKDFFCVVRKIKEQNDSRSQ